MVTFPVRLNFGASVVGCLVPYVDFPNKDEPGVATFPKSPPYLGFCYYYFLVAAPNSEGVVAG